MLLQRSNARVRLSLPISSFHNQSSLPSPRPNPSIHRNIIQNPINPTHPSSSSSPWVVKIISTLYAHLPAHRAHLSVLRNALTPSIAYHVIRRLNNPKLALGFFGLTRSSFEFNHPTETYNFLIVTLSRAGLKDSAKVVFDWMRQDGHSPDSWVVGLLVSSHAEAVNSSRCPVLSQVARDVLAIPVSTVASESAFSTGGRVLDPYHSSLSPKTVECLICAQDWFRSSNVATDLENVTEEFQAFEELEVDFDEV